MSKDSRRCSKPETERFLSRSERMALVTTIVRGVASGVARAVITWLIPHLP